MRMDFRKIFQLQKFTGYEMSHEQTACFSHPVKCCLIGIPVVTYDNLQ